ncbi:MAG: ornithine cyclodeaminase family protein, partial [Chloroflexota bacterium]|nr:ornithine cyclodeaminase family protein [Chloroflexota bacterium]
MVKSAGLPPSGNSAENEILILDSRQTEELLSMREALSVVENAFRLEARGKTIMPPKLYLTLPQYQGDFRAMPAYIDDSAGLKWVSVYPDNWKYGLPTVIATILLCDPVTGRLLAMMDGTYLTSMRTGAAGGVAVKYLARQDSSVIGIIGAGTQARTQLWAISEVLPAIKEVKVYDKRPEASQKYAEAMEARLKLKVRAVATIEAAADADIVVAVTPATTPVIRKQHIRSGTHINAIGADAKGKEELEPEILKTAKLIVDNIVQAAHSGEINVRISQGVITVEDIYGTLGDVVTQRKKGG